MNTLSRILLLCALAFHLPLSAEIIDHLVFEPPAPIANGKRIVLVSGDEEYRSEESCPMLAKLLSQRHGFHCTVLFAIEPGTDIINPNHTRNIPHLESLYEADLLILATRWRTLPGEQLQPILDYLNAGKPVFAFRTATHAFKNDDFFGGYDWRNFGKNVVGENWLSHHGKHKVQGGRAVIVPENVDHPVLNSVKDIFTWSDIYGIQHLDQQAATVLLRGAVTESLEPDSAIVDGPQNKPMMPLAWLKDYPTPDGNGSGICFATTAGAAYDLQVEDLRRLFVNAAYHLLDLPVPEKADVTLVDPYTPSFYGFQAKDYFLKRGLRVSDYRMGHFARSILSEDELETLDKQTKAQAGLRLNKNARVAVLGNGLSERMLYHGFFETELHLRFPEHKLFLRNLSRSGFTAGFRPHPSRDSQWAFPGAAAFHPELQYHSGKGHFPSDDQWLADIDPDLILACYGFNESFAGPDGLEAFRGELSAFIDHTLAQNKKGDAPPQLALVSPIAFQDLSRHRDLADGASANRNLALYAAAMRQVAAEKGVAFVDLFSPTQSWFESSDEVLTVNGAHLNKAGYRRLAPLLADALFPGSRRASFSDEKTEALRRAVLDKDWYWLHDYQIPNGVHTHGRRFQPFGDENYPEEIEKTRQLTANRDRAIWSLLADEPFDLAAADAATRPLSPIRTNAPDRAVKNPYRYGQDALDSIATAEGYRIELFASEVEFPDLANPVQLSFDNKGRLWVAVMPSYPHYKPGDPKPNDKLLILEDTDGDGKADKQTVFADQLHLPTGFELAPEGVYLSQAPNLVLLRDLDGDDRADSREIILSGFDTHDTHHAISAFHADPAGGILMSEGVYLHTNVETAYGPIRGVNGGVFRFDPNRQELRRLVQSHLPNPWGIATDQWGQDFILATSHSDLFWMLPIQVKTRYGQITFGTESLIPQKHRVRPTSGLEFVSSRHFPDEVQGDYLLNNCIGFLGAKQHSIQNDGTGYRSEFRQNLFRSSDPNFRAVDLEFAPDGSLYLVDWHNQLVGHMQHNARDPLRDHAHGRIYRVTHKERPLVDPAPIHGATIASLLDNLKLPEIRTRYRTRRELRGRNATELLPALKSWIENLDTSHPEHERFLLEALWVSWGINRIDTDLLRQLLQSRTPEVRSAAVRALGYHLDEFPDHSELLQAAASDPHGRVRLEAIVAASWLDNPDARKAIELAGQKPLDAWTQNAYQQSLANLGGEARQAVTKGDPAPAHLDAASRESWERGAEIYRREGHCATCHQADGLGLPAAQFPPLDGTKWVNGSAERLIDLTLHGLLGPVEVNGVRYPGHVPMTQFAGILSDQEIADVLTYVRNAWSNGANPISPEQVAKVRSSSSDKVGFWTAEELSKKYPENND
ncbi:PVC-type heme-binding CxxCH protein [Pelagicoccus sp. SDUM812005]|uniref:PVC-type heme-binding CxxCH protein n=1 Tax=Pelagicoccus sp. SDUM812005 TaxID=3041257 RepID=UPI00280DE1CB|nr:PVC-type heme-binding CxxCH protein [Pelagicoccus sp. SDUM812005]MDQ8180614.1 GDSL-type esterase/lipase family protein [Pelagicoccus sp. SDUM812005]